jgi:hypothetical protein
MVLQAEDVVKEDFLVLSVRTTVIEGAKAVKGSKHRFAVIGAHHAGHGPGTAER